MTVSVVSLALAGAAIPLGAGAASAAPAVRGSAWGRHQAVKAPVVPVGRNRPVVSDTHLSAAAAVVAQSAAGAASARASSGTGVVSLAVPPSGQGQVPWHQYSDTRLTDSLVARVDLSSGDLLLAGTDFDIAGAGDRLQLDQTYSSFTGVGGTVGSRWWLNYDRRLEVSGSDVYAVDSTGAVVHFTASGTSGVYTTLAGYSQDLTRNSDGTYTLTDRKTGAKDTYTSAGALSKVTSRNGAAITVAQHSSGGYKLTEIRTGRFIDLAPYNSTQWRATDNTGRYAKFDTDGYGNLVKVTDTAGQATSFGYESLSETDFRINKITSPNGDVTRLAYDSSNRIRSLQRITDTAANTGPAWTYSYSASDPSTAGTTTVTTPDLHATVYTHDGEGQVTKVTDPLGHSRSRTYDPNHNVATATDAMGTGGSGGNTTIYGWDSRNNPTSAKLPTGATAAFSGYATIAGADLPASLTDAQGNKTSYSYDTAGNTLSVAVTGSAAATRSSTYNDSSPTCGGFAGQRCTSRDAGGKTTSFHYDAKGNLDKVTPPSPLGATAYTYDALGRPETATDGRGITTTYTYDARDRLKQATTSGGASVTYTYDGDGNRRTRTDATGTTSYTPDALDRESVRTLSDGSRTVLSYDGDGNVATYTDPTGQVVYGYDAAERLTSLKDPSGATTTYGYNNDDVRTSTTYPGGTVQTVTVDNSNRPRTISAKNGSTTFTDLAYTYTTGPNAGDGALIHTRKDNQSGATATYTYDSQNRLSRDLETNTAGTTTAGWLYCYDAAGNLQNAYSSGVTSSSDCSGPRVFQYTVNDASEISDPHNITPGAWAYDPDGNETVADSAAGTRTGETWSDFNQLTALTVGGTAYTAAYSGTDNGERTTLKAGSTTTVFHNGPEGLAGSTTNGVDTGFTRDPQGTLNSMRTGGSSYYYLTDAQGSVLGLVDAAGHRTATYTYDPLGNSRTTTQTVPQPYRFQGTYLDPTGLYTMGARYYDPTLGRFTQTDPSGKETNPYAAFGNDPVNHTDPGGTSFLDDLGTGLNFASIVYAGITGGTDAAAAATAGVIADLGISGLCEAGAAFFSEGSATAPALPYCMAIGTAAGGYVSSNYN